MDKTDPRQRDEAWFALADAEHCRLFRCSMTERDTHHVDEQDAIENTFPEQEHARPMTQGGMTHHVEEKERRFAGEIVAWLTGKAKEHEMDRLFLFATPRVLGLVRKIELGSLTGHFQEVQGDLMRLGANQLAEHPLIRDLMCGPRADNGR